MTMQWCTINLSDLLYPKKSLESIRLLLGLDTGKLCDVHADFRINVFRHSHSNEMDYRIVHGSFKETLTQVEINELFNNINIAMEKYNALPAYDESRTIDHFRLLINATTERVASIGTLIKFKYVSSAEANILTEKDVPSYGNASTPPPFYAKAWSNVSHKFHSWNHPSTRKGLGVVTGLTLLVVGVGAWLYNRRN